MTPYLLILAVLLGIAPGLIAHGKGRNFLLWWIYGAILGPIALLHAILLRQKPNPFYSTESYATTTRTTRPSRQRDTRWRFYWPVALWGAASVAMAIVIVAAYSILNPGSITIPGQERLAQNRPNQERPGQEREVSVSADRAPAAQRADAAPATRSLIVEKPAAERPRPGNEPPTVRVTVRHDTLAPPPEQMARAPAMPVERINPDRKASEAQSLERTTPRTTIPVAPSPPTQATPDAGTAETGKSPTTPAAGIASLPTIPESKETAKPASRKAAAPKPAEPSPAKPAKKAGPATNVTAVGETVQIVQMTLAKKGYDPGPANGRAGLKTQTAIRKFQADRGLRPTGAIDYDLLEKLGIVGPRVHAFRPPPGATPGR